MRQPVPALSRLSHVTGSPSIIALPIGLPENASAVVPLQTIESPILRQAVAYWDELRGARAYPAREDMKPRDLTPLLRNIVLLRLLDGGKDYEYRIVGDAHVIAHGFTMQGLRVSDVDSYAPGYGTVLKSLYDRAVRRREAYAFRGWLQRSDRNQRYLYSESVFMPMGPAGEAIDHVLTVSVYTPRDSFDR